MLPPRYQDLSTPLDFAAALEPVHAAVLSLLCAAPRCRDEMHALLARRAYRPYSIHTVTNALSLLWRLGLAQRTPAHGYFLTPLGEAVQDALWHIEEAA